ncbi:membrane transporter [Dichomitus squalens LYAD-421 SS1]|uniref:membrane transporter n=1 Tax=Dichomitus squalens (strain LYAD-421) TaxID=732165 RepID=UPI0004411A0C|nr:membrane transporter [Dichomitus squalens LYAD-421 SS1]EJF63251.1 membrane transporter [Dichomitus squalens LYAD-421 SS1]
MGDVVSLDLGPGKASSDSVRKAEKPASPSFENPSGDLEGKMVVEVEDHDIFDGNNAAIEPVYHAKARILNAAFREIGMGKYQWFLFVVAGFGWFSDNLWQQVTGLIINPVVLEFVGTKGPFILLPQTIGLLVGAVFWGVGCDLWGRRWSFNLTLLITGVFAIAAGGANNEVTLCALIGVYAIGCGGNLPVDSAVFLEFVPATHQWLLTVLSIWWAIGQLVGALVAWPLIANFSCSSAVGCTREKNMGWRYLLWALGGLMVVLFIIRFFVFHLYESPKYLMGRGRDEEAVKVVHQIAQYNGKKSSLAVEMLRECEKLAEAADAGGNYGREPSMPMDTSMKAAFMRQVRKLNSDHLQALFRPKKFAYSTSLLIVLWAFIGLASPLYNSFVTVFLQHKGVETGDGSLYITYRNQVILTRLGRKGTLAISTALSGVFLLASTTSRTSDVLLGWNCGYTSVNNVMFGVLYAVSPELFPTKDRGTGNALVASANRVFGIMAPIIALYANLNTPIPIYVSGSLFVVSGVIALLLPFESRGKAAI